MFGPVLHGDHVTLRPADDSDPPRFVPWFADMEVTRYLGRRMAVALYYEVEMLKKLGESDQDVWWVIEVAGEAIGATGIHAIDWINSHGTTGIVIGAKGQWGKGYATEAMHLRTRYAFRDLNLHKLMTEVFVGNVASRRALEKNGYRGIGTSRDHFFTLGRWHDVWLAEVLREDWERAQTV
ncbi:MAG: GNAT family protein [Chloroflexota bacterium]